MLMMIVARLVSPRPRVMTAFYICLPVLFGTQRVNVVAKSKKMRKILTHQGMMTLRGIKSQRKPHKILEEIQFEIYYTEFIYVMSAWNRWMKRWSVNI